MSFSNQAAWDRALRIVLGAGMLLLGWFQLPDGLLQAGEQAFLTIELHNAGAAPAEDVTARVHIDDRYLQVDHDLQFGTIDAGASASNVNFSIFPFNRSVALTSASRSIRLISASISSAVASE